MNREVLTGEQGRDKEEKKMFNYLKHHRIDFSFLVEIFVIYCIKLNKSWHLKGVPLVRPLKILILVYLRVILTVRAYQVLMDTAATVGLPGVQKEKRSPFDLT